MPYARRMKALSIEGECKALIVTGLLGMPLGILIFLPFYHWPHDIFHVSSEVADDSRTQRRPNPDPLPSLHRCAP